jgi:Fe-S cluster assembly protein SufD
VQEISTTVKPDTQNTKLLEPWKLAYARYVAARPALDWLQPLRDRAMGAFATDGFPAIRQEDWKYTNLAPVVTRSAEYLAHGPDTEGSKNIGLMISRLPSTDAGPLLVFVNGRYEPALSRQGTVEGFHISTLTDTDASSREEIRSRLGRRADISKHQLAALNTAFLTDGVIITIEPDSRPAAPVTVVFAADDQPVSVQPRILLAAGSNSQATLIEHHLGTGAGLTNAITEIDCANGASLSYVKLQNVSADSYHLAAQHVHLERDSRFDAVHVDIGAALARNDLNISLQGPGAEARLHGLFMANGQRHVDNHTLLDHRARNTVSTENFRGIIDDHGRGVFNGKIIVSEGADGTNAQLENRNLLLAKTAEVDTKPELEIYTDDVKCAHGATTGQLDETAVFYLRSRGISRDNARRLLISAFMQEIISQIGDHELGVYIQDLAEDLLPGTGTSTESS